MSDSSDLVASGYDAFYTSWGESPTLRRIWREHVTGPDYPEEFAHISFLPLTQLRSLTESLSVTTGEVLVDLACGAGGPGLWAAKETGARLVGIDLTPMAAKRATERAGALGMSERATFTQGTFEATGLESASADAAMSVDALQYVPDKSKALAEAARLLRPGGHFAFVAFELDTERVQGWTSGTTLSATIGRASNRRVSRSFVTTRSRIGRSTSLQGSAPFSNSGRCWKLNSVKRPRPHF